MMSSDDGDLIGEAEGIAAAVACLAGPGGRYTTGATIPVDGGYTV
jgi:3-oxoacyl-[acyl-carrier protein] reductase